MTQTEKDIALRLGSVLKAKRAELGLSQADFAALLGLKLRNSIANFEAGISVPSLKTLAVIEEKLRLQVNIHQI